MPLQTDSVDQEGLARTTDGKLYVTLGSGSTIPSPTFTGTGGSGVPFVIAQSYAAVSGAADTVENTLATITVPANAIGANGSIRLRLAFTNTNNANIKTMRVRFSGAAGTIIVSRDMASAGAWDFDLIMANRNATNSQVTRGYGLNSVGSVGVPTIAASAIDTTAATTLVVTIQKATAGDTVTLEGYTAELIKP